MFFGSNSILGLACAGIVFCSCNDFKSPCLHKSETQSACACEQVYHFISHFNYLLFVVVIIRFKTSLFLYKDEKSIEVYSLCLTSLSSI